MEEYTYELKIPKERIAVLIGKKGETKKKIEETTNLKLDIDSKEGEVVISGTDSLALFTAKEILRAIGRGFNPDVALLILKNDYGFELLNINDYARSSNDSLRLKGRVIGKQGKAREHIEEMTETNICVYGKTIGIIGRQENVSIAVKAIENLLKGSPHANVYSWLEKTRRKMKTTEYFSKQENNKL